MLYRQKPQNYDIIKLNKEMYDNMSGNTPYMIPKWFQEIINVEEFPVLEAKEGVFVLSYDAESEQKIIQLDDDVCVIHAPTGEVNVTVITQDDLLMNFEEVKPEQERLSPEEMDELLAKSPSPNRIDSDHLDSVIVGHTYTVFGGRMTVCTMETRNGMLVTGESTAADAENFDAAIGRSIAYENARGKVAAFEAYLIRERMFIQNAKA